MTTNDNIILKFKPKLIDIQDTDLLNMSVQTERLLIYGEIHGIKENADIIYTLVHHLDIKRIVIESSPSVAGFIDAASKGVYDFSLIDVDTFDTSILSLEVAKTIATLLSEGQIEDVRYIDTYFDNLDPSKMDHPASPQEREQILADNILAMNRPKSTLCLLGQWHTQTQPMEMGDGITHYSALYRLRKVLPNIPLVHNIYGGGTAFNDGRVLDLPHRQDVEEKYYVRQISDIDFDLHVPVGHHSLLSK
ncbi:MAG: hypothetical protein WBB33_02980 [Candidatus Saccharimonadales bacterium]